MIEDQRLVHFCLHSYQLQAADCSHGIVSYRKNLVYVQVYSEGSRRLTASRCIPSQGKSCPAHTALSSFFTGKDSCSLATFHQKPGLLPFFTTLCVEKKVANSAEKGLLRTDMDTQRQQMQREKQDTEQARQELTGAFRENNRALLLRSASQVAALARVLRNMPPYSEDLPAWLANIFRLESLEIESWGGNVDALLPHLRSLPYLCRLRLDFASYDQKLLLSTLEELQNLRALNLDGALFRHFPKSFANLKSLESFSYKFYACPLDEVFDTLATLPRLKRLRLMNGFPDEQGDSLPPSFGRLQAMEELLFFDWVGLNSLPESVGELRKLRMLNLKNSDASHYRDARISALPESLCTLPMLEHLNLYGLNRLRQLPKDFSGLDNLKYLDIILTGISELKLTPRQWGNLETLRMQGPLPDFRQCTSLKRLDLYMGRGFVRLPHISSLNKLESLTIYGQFLATADFPTSLPALRSITLHCNMTSLPRDVAKLNSLEEITIWGAGSLEALPEEIGHLPSLKRLSVEASGIRALPQSVLEREDLHIRVSTRWLKFSRSPSVEGQPG